MRRSFSGIAIILLLLCSCNGKKAESVDDVAAPIATVADTDSIARVEDAANPPTAADGFFDDFVYSFMHNRTFQKQRVAFPLRNVVDGKETFISKEEWTFDQLYAHNDTYTMLFENERSVENAKDTAIHSVTVEWVYLTQGRVKQYRFSKQCGQWMLVALDSHALEKNANCDFFSFYRQFSTDAAYQMKHISNPIAFKTYDTDTFQEIEGVLDVNQWPDFQPDMPTKVITNINYGQSYATNTQRVLVITSPSAGMSCTLTFKKKKGTWKLVGMESI